MRIVQIVAPAIQADTLEVISYKDAIRPTVATATTINNTVEQYGYSVTVQSVELAEKETRAYISVTNNGSSEFSLYGFNMVLIQDGTQYEYTPNYMAHYPELQSSIRTVWQIRLFLQYRIRLISLSLLLKSP